jgi:o-succinylbenzoate---CoA ligase
MTTPIYNTLHPKFKWNGFHLNVQELCHMASDFIEKGEDFQKPMGHFILNWFDDKPHLEVTTSGTTGAAKIITIQKLAMYHSAIATGAFFDLQPSDKALHCLPMQYIAGKMMLVRAMVLGFEITIVAPSASPLKGIYENYDFVAMVPLQVENSLDKLSQIKTLIVGGAKINGTLAAKLLGSKANIYETYGMTETITHIAAKKIQDNAFTVFPAVIITLDQRGCLVINAPNLTLETLETNDLVEITAPNQFIWLGRYDNVINSGGIKLIPEQIEAKLAAKLHQRFFVAGMLDEVLGEKLVLFIEGEPVVIPSATFDDLSKYEKPKAIQFVSQFLETATGKIKRSQIITSIR